VHPPDLLELVAHELRTPITSLYGAAQLLDRNAMGAWARTDLVAEMAAEAARLVRFLEDLLALADASAGAISVEPVLVQRILDQVLAQVRQEHPDAQWRLHPRSIPGPVMADPEALRHALGNLVGHAVRASEGGPPVQIGLSNGGGRVEVTVRERVRRASHGDEVLDRGDLLVEPGGRLWLASAQALVGAMGGQLLVSRRATQRILRLTLPEVAAADGPG
jgi:signal transduction histidine kinase